MGGMRAFAGISTFSPCDGAALDPLNITANLIPKNLSHKSALELERFGAGRRDCEVGLSTVLAWEAWTMTAKPLSRGQ
jgi:hypothetical protein